MNYFQTIFIIVFLHTSLGANVSSYSFENDAFFKTDKHYTNSLSYSYLENDNNNSASHILDFLPFKKDLSKKSEQIVFQHFIFTPEDTKKYEKITDDIPYAGVFLLEKTLFRWEEDFFHEFGLGFCLIGPLALGEEGQNGIHKVIGANKANGWDNQLGNKLHIGFTYAYGEKSWQLELKNNKKIDLINQVRFNIGTGFRDFIVGSNLRFGYNIPNNFATVGKTFGLNQNSSLNLDSKKNKDFGFSISAGLFYSYIDYFYISDYDSSYKPEKLRHLSGQNIELSLYYDKYALNINIKKETNLKNLNHFQQWGIVSLKKVF